MSDELNRWSNVLDSAGIIVKRIYRRDYATQEEYAAAVKENQKAVKDDSPRPAKPMLYQVIDDKVSAETARCADVVREMLKWPYELDETTIPTIAKWLIREIEKGAE